MALIHIQQHSSFRNVLQQTAVTEEKSY